VAKVGTSNPDRTISLKRLQCVVENNKRDEVTGEWRKLHSEELNDLYCSPNIVRFIKSRRMRWTGHVARLGEKIGICRVLVGKPEGKRPRETQA
jgi:hypothetical protein